VFRPFHKFQFHFTFVLLILLHFEVKIVLASNGKKPVPSPVKLQEYLFGLAMVWKGKCTNRRKER
jgi:hypothetical protein